MPNASPTPVTELTYRNGSLEDLDRNGIVDRVLSSSAFRRAKRLRQLLKYAVGADAAGETPNEHLIAVAAFERGDDFDPRINPMVRVQFGRLRKRLAEYYETEGKADPIRIALPERGYRPRFEPNEETGRQTGSVMQSQRVPSPIHDNVSLAVLPFANLTGNPDLSVFCQGLTEELISAMSTLDQVDVVSRTSAFQFEGQALDVREVGKDLDVSLVLEGSVRRENEQTRVTVQLTTVEDGFVLWSGSFDRKMEALIPLQQDITGAIVGSLRPRFAEVAA